MAYPMLNDHLSRYTCETIDEAPERVGLYAWYGVFLAGRKDWEFELERGMDAGIRRLQILLSQHSQRYFAPPLDITGKGTFSTTWVGQLEDTTPQILMRVLSNEDEIPEGGTKYDKERAPELRESLQHRDLRGALVAALEAAGPVLAAPLYIGVAKNLKTRLETHARQLYELSSLAAKEPTFRQRLLLSSQTTFASRAVAMGYSPDTLEVWALNLEGVVLGGMKADRMRTVAEAVEWLLNRWHRPILGKK